MAAAIIGPATHLIFPGRGDPLSRRPAASRSGWDKFLMAMRFMHRPTILPFRTLRAPNRVVMPWRLRLWVIVPQRPFFSGKPGGVQSRRSLFFFAVSRELTSAGVSESAYPLRGDSHLTGELRVPLPLVRLYICDFPAPRKIPIRKHHRCGILVRFSSLEPAAESVARLRAPMRGAACS